MTSKPTATAQYRSRPGTKQVRSAVDATMTPSGSPALVIPVSNPGMGRRKPPSEGLRSVRGGMHCRVDWDGTRNDAGGILMAAGFTWPRAVVGCSTRRWDHARCATDLPPDVTGPNENDEDSARAEGLPSPGMTGELAAATIECGRRVGVRSTTPTRCVGRSVDAHPDDLRSGLVDSSRVSHRRPGSRPSRGSSHVGGQRRACPRTARSRRPAGWRGSRLRRLPRRLR